MSYSTWQMDLSSKSPGTSSQLQHPSLQMGTMKNRHGDSVVALNTPEHRVAVEMRSGVSGSARHAGLDQSPCAAEAVADIHHAPAATWC